jgi:DNA-directed RNA polymerase specialized sigma24 family protein
MGELLRDDVELLGTLGERLAQRDGSWPRWLWTISTNAAIDHLRRHADDLARDDEGSADLATDRERRDEQEDDPSPLVDAHRIWTKARTLLTKKQMNVLAGWLDGQSGDELARAGKLAGGVDEATRLVRSGMARLRHHYAKELRDAAPAKAKAPKPPPRRARRNST